MKANYETPKTTSEVILGNLYDMNKQIMDQRPKLSDADIQIAKEQLRKWLSDNFKQKYFMLLCHELRDYTLFNLDKTSTWAIAKPNAIFNCANDILECMSNRGTILAIDRQPDDVWELWLRTEEGSFVYYLFPYGDAVLEY